MQIGAVQAPLEKRNPQIGYEGTYGRLQFQQYTFVEFPKTMKSKGRKAIVHNKREELEVLTEWGAADAALGETDTKKQTDSHSAIEDALSQVKEAKEALSAKDAEIEALKKQLAAQGQAKTVAEAPSKAPAAPPEATKK